MKPNFSVLFCDDIRHEIGGKVSLMGIYGTHLLLPSIPGILTKLTVHFSVELPTELKPESVQINVLVNGIKHATIDLAGIGYNDESAKEVNGHRLLGGTELFNIEFTEKSRIEAIIELDNVKEYSALLIIDSKDNYSQD